MSDKDTENVKVDNVEDAENVSVKDKVKNKIETFKERKDEALKDGVGSFLKRQAGKAYKGLKGEVTGSPKDHLKSAALGLGMGLLYMGLMVGLSFVLGVGFGAGVGITAFMMGMFSSSFKSRTKKRVSAPKKLTYITTRIATFVGIAFAVYSLTGGRVREVFNQKATCANPEPQKIESLFNFEARKKPLDDMGIKLNLDLPPF